MESLKKIEAACRRFEEAAIKHAEATETGNYAQANKSYQVIAKSARYLKECLFLNAMLCKYCKVLQVAIIFIR